MIFVCCRNVFICSLHGLKSVVLFFVFLISLYYVLVCFACFYVVLYVVCMLFIGFSHMVIMSLYVFFMFSYILMYLVNLWSENHVSQSA